MAILTLFDRDGTKYPCFFDDCDSGLVEKYKWHIHKDKRGYLYVRSLDIVNKKWIWHFMHQVIMKPEKGYVVDHLDRNGLNNCRSNLRVVSQSENILNSKKYKKALSRQYLPRGVQEHWYKGRLRFKTQIKYNGIGKYLGLFNDVTSASQAYLDEVRRLGIYQHS